MKRQTENHTDCRPKTQNSYAMIKYFIIFTIIGLFIGRVPSFSVRTFYITAISFVWGYHTGIIWGFAAMGELFLGCFISMAISSSINTRQIYDAKDQCQKSFADFSRIVVFRAKTLAILKLEMRFTVDTPGVHQEAFNRATRSAFELGLNEYDAAIGFMLCQLKELSRPIHQYNINTYVERLCDCMRLTSLSTGAMTMLEIYIVDHRSDFNGDLLNRSELAFVFNILNRNDLNFYSASPGNASSDALTSETSHSVRRAEYPIRSTR